MEKSTEAERGEAQAAVEAADAPQRTAFSRPRSKISLAIALVAAIVLLTVLLPSSAPAAKYTDVREIVALPAAYDGKTVAVVGGVEYGSVSVGSRMVFNLTDYANGSVSIRVIYDAGMDANFGEGKQVLAEGRVAVESGVPKLYATKISIGCPTDYRGQSPTQ